MPISLVHLTAADGTFSATGETEWEREHTFTMATARLLGRTTAATGAVEEITVGTGLTLSAGDLSANAATVAWTGITAGSGSATTANGDSAIVYQTAQTTASRISWRFTESAAGISTGTPVLLQIDTVAASTALPLLVRSRATEVFRVSPSSVQILSAAGTTSAPVYSGVAGTDTGMYFPTAAQVGFVVAASNRARITNDNQIGYFIVTSDPAEYPDSDSSIRALISTSNASTTLSSFRSIYAQATESTVDSLSILRARGTVSAPTVITTGDNLGTLGAYGYVGATNKYQLAAQILFDSTGTISDSATGIGGIIVFAHATVGAEPVTVVQMKSQHIVHSGTAPTITAGGGTGPTIVGTDEAFEVTIGTGGVATSVEVTFGNAFTTNAPICVAASDTDIVAFKCVTTVTKVTITATLAFTAGSILHVVCRGWE